MPPAAKDTVPAGGSAKCSLAVEGLAECSLAAEDNVPTGGSAECGLAAEDIVKCSPAENELCLWEARPNANLTAKHC